MKKERMVRLVLKKHLLILILFLISVNRIKAKDYPFVEKKWTIINTVNNQEVDKQIVNQDDEEVLQLSKSCVALLNGNYSNFTIDFEIKGGSMPGIGFRSNNLLDFEYFYLRMGNSGKNTAIQYFPVYNGATAWMIYNYPKYETVAEFSEDKWIHVKLEVYDDNMRVFVNNETVPNMEVKLKNTEQKNGNIFFLAGFKDSYFRNVEIQELKSGNDIVEPDSPYKYICAWKLSEQFEVDFNCQKEVYSKYQEQKELKNWKDITVDKDGIVNISKYYKYPRNTVIATTEINSDKDKELDLLYDYTFSMVIMLNGEILFCGTELDTKNFMRVIDGEEHLTLNLKEGKNELMFMIKADDVWQKAVNNAPYLGRNQAANWGFIARLANYEGIEFDNNSN